mgnify:CR=1 FL=1
MKAALNNIIFYDNLGEFVLTNQSMNLNLGNINDDLKGSLRNANLLINFPKRHSSLRNKELKIFIDKDKITLQPTDILFNKKSVITIAAGFTEIFSKMNNTFLTDYNEKIENKKNR